MMALQKFPGISVKSQWDSVRYIQQQQQTDDFSKMLNDDSAQHLVMTQHNTSQLGLGLELGGIGVRVRGLEFGALGLG